MLCMMLTVVVAYAASTLAVDPLGLIFPTKNAEQCVPTLVGWEGGQGPFTLTGEDRKTVELFPNIPASTTSFLWQTNIPQDTIWAFSLNDSSGQFTDSPLFFIEPGKISRRDDLESLLYALLEFYHGRLPWQGLPEPKWTSKTALARDMKTTAPSHALLARSAPEFAAYHAHVAGLQYGERPDYALLRGLFREWMRTEGWAFDGNFDWMDAAGLEKGTLLPEEYVLSLDFQQQPRGKEAEPYSIIHRDEVRVRERLAEPRRSRTHPPPTTTAATHTSRRQRQS
ncbi:hypothetical protein VTO73DRAFT_10743 [Trametes versicolor]